MSFGGDASDVLDAAVERLVEEGIVVVVAAGNAASEACSFSPARARAAITVAASAVDDTVASFSNVGACVRIFAPGERVADLGGAHCAAKAAGVGGLLSRKVLPHSRVEEVSRAEAQRVVS